MNCHEYSTTTMYDFHRRNDFLQSKNISEPNETFEQMIGRACDAICNIESIWNDSSNYINNMRDRFYFLFANNIITLGTPILMQIGKPLMKSISSCAAIPVNLKEPLAKVKSTIEFYYENNMGSGFNLSYLNNPTEVLLALNDHAEEISIKNKKIRHIGNIAILDCTHPRINEFIKLKSKADILDHFNLSVNLSDKFCLSHKKNLPFELKNGDIISTKKLIETLSESIYKSAEPGIIFLDRVNQFNPTTNVGLYTTTAPCTEMGLLNGETCVFGYINLVKICKKNHKNNYCINYDLLKDTTSIITRALDDCVQIQINKNNPDKNILLKKRKIAIGVCGFADLLVMLKVGYGSRKSIEVLKNILLTITYYSKVESIQLGKERGCFLAFNESRFLDERFLYKKFGTVGNSIFNKNNWIKLDKLIHKTRFLRNSSTTALPPSGQSSLLLGVSPSIEPWFSLNGKELLIHEVLPELSLNYISSIIKEGNLKIFPKDVRETLLCATEIDYEKQINIITSATECIDESISKTINLKEESSIELIQTILENVIDSNIKGISIFRNKSLCNQPYTLQ